MGRKQQNAQAENQQDSTPHGSDRQSPISPSLPSLPLRALETRKADPWSRKDTNSGISKYLYLLSFTFGTNCRVQSVHVGVFDLPYRRRAGAGQDPRLS